MNENIYPFQHSPAGSFYDLLRNAQVQYAQLVKEAKEQEEPHKHQIRIVNGMGYAIRWCTVPGCMQSWRLNVRSGIFDDMPDAVWETIAEPVDLTIPVLPDYED